MLSIALGLHVSFVPFCERIVPNFLYLQIFCGFMIPERHEISLHSEQLGSANNNFRFFVRSSLHFYVHTPLWSNWYTQNKNCEQNRRPLMWEIWHDLFLSKLQLSPLGWFVSAQIVRSVPDVTNRRSDNTIIRNIFLVERKVTWVPHSKLNALCHLLNCRVACVICETRKTTLTEILAVSTSWTYPKGSLHATGLMADFGLFCETGTLGFFPFLNLPYTKLFCFQSKFLSTKKEFFSPLELFCRKHFCTVGKHAQGRLPSGLSL